MLAERRRSILQVVLQPFHKGLRATGALERLDQRHGRRVVAVQRPELLRNNPHTQPPAKPPIRLQPQSAVHRRQRPPAKVPFCPSLDSQPVGPPSARPPARCVISSGSRWLSATRHRLSGLDFSPPFKQIERLWQEEGNWYDDHSDTNNTHIMLRMRAWPNAHEQVIKFVTILAIKVRRSYEASRCHHTHTHTKRHTRTTFAMLRWGIATVQSYMP